MKKGMDAVIAKAQKRAPLFKRKLAAKLEAGSSAKSAPASDYGAAKGEKADTKAASSSGGDFNAKMDECMRRIAALEAKLAEASDDDSEDDDV